MKQPEATLLYIACPLTAVGLPVGAILLGRAARKSPGSRVTRVLSCVLLWATFDVALLAS